MPTGVTKVAAGGRFPVRSIPSASPEVDARLGSGSGSDYTDSSGRQSPGTPPDLSALQAECHPDSLPCAPDIIIPGGLPMLCTRLDSEEMACSTPAAGGGISPGGSRTDALRRRLRTVSGSKAENLVLRKGEKLVYTAGRPPWYDTAGQTHREPFIIGISGGSASGKTTVANRIIEQLDIPWVTLLSLDSFYKVLNIEQHTLAENNEYDFDHPDAFDFELCEDTLRKLRVGKMVEVPVYNFTSHSREKHSKTMYGADVLIFEGIMAFYKQKIVDLMDLKIFVDTDADIRLARRLKRDIVDRGRDVEGVIKQYSRTVKPSYDNYIAPSMRHADIIIPRGGENVIAIDLIVKHIKKKLKERGYCNRSQLAKIQSGLPIPDCVHILKETSQIKGLHTFVRNRETSPDEFIFYSKRLMRLLIEYALSLLPYLERSVDTPQGTKYVGRKRDASICGVSILRAGETMEPALREVVKDCKMGKMLIQTNPDTDDPELYYLRLPKDIHRFHVFLMDATVATGAAAMMAIRVLLDHNVPEENITLLSLLSAEPGIQSVAYAFPRVKQATTAIDPHLSQNYYILPGLGNFGDRYFGTTYDPEMEDNDEYEGDGFDMGGATTEEDE